MKKMTGMSLIEIVVAIVIVGISLSAVISAFGVASQGSVNPMIRQQAIYIADAYISEALSLPPHDPSLPYLSDLGAETGETSRELFDDVMDFGQITNEVGARSRDGALIAGLEKYQIDVSTEGAGSCSISGVNCVKITVSVSHPSGITIGLSGYRMLMPNV